MKKTLIQAGVIIAVISSATYMYFQHTKKYPSTENAYVNANLIYVAPKVSGYVTEVLVKNNQLVHKGDTLFRIETTDYTVQLAQEQQKLKYIVEQEINAKTQINNATASLASAKANYEHLKTQVSRYKLMNQQNVASTEELQNYQTQLVQAKSQYEQMQNSLAQAKTQVVAVNAQIAEAKSKVENAQNHVGYTDIISPVNGYVTNLYLTNGQYVSASQQLFGLIDNDSWWIDANFKETDLERIKPGQTVKISLDMYSNTDYKGIVQSLSYASGTTFSLLPAQNATGNWVKVTQRFTIRIKLDNNPKSPLRVGSSAAVEINTLK